MSATVGVSPGSVVLGSTSLLGQLRAPFVDPGVDPRLRQARLGAVLHVAACLIGAATIPFLPASTHPGWLWALVAGGSAMAGLLLLLPWQRWPDRALLVPIVGSLLFIGVGIGGLGHALSFYLPLYGLTFVFVGVTQRPGTAALLSPVALASGSAELLSGDNQLLFIPLMIMVGVCAVLGELIARYVRLQRIAGETLDELLMSVAGLTACRTVSEASDLGAAVVSRLVGADLACVIVPETDGSTRFIYAGGDGMPAEQNEAGRGQVVVDTATGPSGTGLAALQRRMVFVPDARTSELVQRSWLDEHDIASALYLPLFGRPGVVAGVAVAGFHRQHRSVDAITVRGLNLVAEATGRVVDQLRQSERLARDADTDPLTGLDNRRVFFRELSKITDGDAVVFLDLDHFKNLNDTQGHAEGDRALAAFGALLREQVRDSDVAARYGGEEFVVLVRGRGRPDAEQMVQRLREVWEEYSGMTFSAGAALHEPARQPSATLAAADSAVYLAKATGRNRMCWSGDVETLGTPSRVSPLVAALNPRQRREGENDAATA